MWAIAGQGGIEADIGEANATDDVFAGRSAEQRALVGQAYPGEICIGIEGSVDELLTIEDDRGPVDVGAAAQEGVEIARTHRIT